LNVTLIGVGATFATQTAVSEHVAIPVPQQSAPPTRDSGTSLYPSGPPISTASEAEREPRPTGDSHRPIPKAVLVLSPSGEPDADDPDADISGRSSFPARAPQVASWRDVGLGLLGVVIGYLCWLYLLYNL
jgi:hypothetical protein